MKQQCACVVSIAYVRVLSLKPVPCAQHIGERGLGASTQKPLYYKGTYIHRIVKGFVAQVFKTLPLIWMLCIS
jgi:cyclophilin family peptidyl-prolyl cis-trans isomerase